MSSQKSGKRRMTQSEVIAHIAKKLNITRAQAKDSFDQLAELAAQVLRSSGEFTLPGIGKLILSERKARAGRNPSTGEAIEIPVKTMLKFRLGKEIKSAVLLEPKAPMEPPIIVSDSTALGGDTNTDSDF
jgi:DNA-binding protein HU-beta